jgi:hypothetical protein
MIVAMLISMSGGRDDDRPWPGVGVPFEVTKEEGEGLVKWGHAVDAGRQFKLDQIPPNLRLPGTAHVTAPAPVSLPAETSAGPADNPAPPEPESSYNSGDLADDAADLADNAADLAGGDEPEDSGPEDAGEPEPPKPGDPKQAWIEYAVSGAPVADRLPRDQAEGMTKVDLMSLYGGRL